MEMFQHDHERMQKESSLAAVVEDCSLKQFRGGRNLKEAATLRSYSSDEIRSSLLWSEPHFGRINEMPVAKATLIASLHSGA